MPALLLALALAADPPGDPVEARRAAIAAELVKVGAALRREIEREDVAALLARVPAEGLRCGERVVPKAKVAQDLSAPRSWLRGVLFGGPGFSAPAGTAPSLRALFRDHAQVAVLVAFARDEEAGPVGRPCLDFRARAAGTPGAPFCFEARGRAWLFTQSLYPCR
ncbi:MAG: hypothetical protein U0229_11010 [Anaeromyxobacter sp.]